MQLKIEKGTFKDYSLEDISDALKKDWLKISKTLK